jgi:hypothetical protein
VAGKVNAGTMTSSLGGTEAMIKVCSAVNPDEKQIVGTRRYLLRTASKSWT